MKQFGVRIPGSGRASPVGIREKISYFVSGVSSGATSVAPCNTVEIEQGVITKRGGRKIKRAYLVCSYELAMEKKQGCPEIFHFLSQSCNKTAFRKTRPASLRHHGDSPAALTVAQKPYQSVALVGFGKPIPRFEFFLFFSLVNGAGFHAIPFSFKNHFTIDKSI